MGKARTAREDFAATNFEADRYPTLARVLARIGEEEDLQEGQVEKLEIHMFASGEATYRVWAPKAEEPEGGHLLAES